MSLFFLVGFMGVGKTTIGKALAARWGLPFLDSDDTFRDLHQGMTTGEYISTFGLEKFRPEEQNALRYLIEHTEKGIIATGGGLPVYPGNMEMMLTAGHVIHLQLSLKQISARLSPEELQKRPVWTSRTPAELQALYNKRLPIYSQAHLLVDASKSIDEILGYLTTWKDSLPR